MKLIYIVFDGILNTVFDSQVLTLLRNNAKCFPNIYLISFESNPEEKRIIQKSKEIEEEIGATVIIESKGRIIGKASMDNLCAKLEAALKKIIEPHEKAILHSRGQMSGYMAVRAREAMSDYRMGVLVDVRALLVEEVVFTTFKEFSLKKFLLLPQVLRNLRGIEREAYWHADFLTCVSEELKEFLVERHRIQEEKVAVIPCGVDIGRFRYDKNQREETRKELSFEDCTVFVYSGSISRWQLVDKAIEFYSRVRKHIPKPRLLLLIGNGSKSLEKYIKKFKIPREEIIIKTLSHAEVPFYLNAGDVAFLLRGKSIVNKVSFPTKFGEYISCGLYVLSTDYVPSIARQIMMNEHLGYIIRNFPKFKDVEIMMIVNAIKTGEILSEDVRRNRFEYACRRLSDEMLHKRYYEVYTNLIGSPKIDS